MIASGSRVSGGGSRAASSRRQRTVSLASCLSVPTTPVGPRFIHPATYSPGAGAPPRRTRPAEFGIVPRSLSNGRPGSGSPRYPTARRIICAGRCNRSPVSTACPLPSRRPRASSSPVTAVRPDMAIGRSRNRRCSRRGRPCGVRCDQSRRMSRLRRADGFSLSVASTASSTCSSAGCTMTSALASSPSSRSSLVVNVACAGPRRP